MSESTNQLLAALPRTEYNALLPNMKRVPLTYGENIYETGDVIRRIYFPDSGIISLLSRVDETSSLEVGIVGSEGMAGVPVFLGSKISANVAVVQGEGFAYTMGVSDFLKASAGGKNLQGGIKRYINSLLTQISQSAACNLFHPIETRLARWLLMTQDRMRSDEFQITQDFLSNMLGVRREAVNKAAGTLRRRDLIKYSRGDLQVIDRQGLENAACPCYNVIRHEYENTPS